MHPVWAELAEEKARNVRVARLRAVPKALPPAHAEARALLAGLRGAARKKVALEVLEVMRGRSWALVRVRPLGFAPAADSDDVLLVKEGQVLQLDEVLELCARQWSDIFVYLVHESRKLAPADESDVEVRASELAAMRPDHGRSAGGRAGGARRPAAEATAATGVVAPATPAQAAAAARSAAPRGAARSLSTMAARKAASQAPAAAAAAVGEEEEEEEETSLTGRQGPAKRPRTGKGGKGGSFGDGAELDESPLKAQAAALGNVAPQFQAWLAASKKETAAYQDWFAIAGPKGAEAATQAKLGACEEQLLDCAGKKADALAELRKAWADFGHRGPHSSSLSSVVVERLMLG
jgi:hypothetical protein